MDSRTKYFEILGIDPTQDKSKIKKAYRKKALDYHPDKNPSKDAQKKFIEINEAYEALTGIQIKKNTTQPQPKTAAEIKAEKIEWAKKQRQKLEALEKAKDLHYFKSRTSGWRWKFFLIGAAYSLIFTTLLTVDYFHTSHHKAVPEVNYFGLLPETIEVEDELFKISSGAFWHNDTRPVQLNYSYFFKDLKSINVLDQYISFNGQPSDRMFRYRLFSSYKTTEFYSYGSVYYVFPFLHLFLLIPTVVVIFKRPHFYFALGRLVTLWAIFPLLVYLSLSNWRILHLFGLL